MLAADTGSLTLHSASGLTIGTVLGSSGATATGSLTVYSDGDLTIAGGAAVNGASPVLAAGGNFINNSGAAAVSASSGRWLVYASDPATSTFGGLDSGNTALWNATYTSRAPGSVTASGNRYLFAVQPVLTVTSTDANKFYGDDASSAIGGNYTITGLRSGVANAFLGDTAASAYGGSPSITSPGAPSTAGVNGSLYPVLVSQGSLSSPTGYGFAFTSAGQLSVTPRPLTVTADSASVVYGNPLRFAGTEFAASGLVNGDNVSGVSLSSAGASGTANVGSYAVTPSAAAGTGLSNYTVQYVNGSLGVTPRPLIFVAQPASRPYGQANPALQGAVVGFVNGDTLGNVAGGTPVWTTTADSTSLPGSYPILGSGLTAVSPNYVLVQDPANRSALAVTPRTALSAAPPDAGKTVFAGNSQAYCVLGPLLTRSEQTRCKLDSDTVRMPVLQGQEAELP